jgi:transcriptional regulator with XRE-family HTH domain
VAGLPQRIGANIRKYRKFVGITQERLAELAGLSGYFLGAVERGQAVISLAALDRLARALGVPVADLVAAQEEETMERLRQELEQHLQRASAEELRALLATCRLLRRRRS